MTPEGTDGENRRAAYRKFWTGVGRRFPDLGAAGSTEQYRESEQRIFSDHLPNLTGLRVFKTDLWDEAKNTRILHWASQQGAAAFGADLSLPIIQQALRNFGNERLRAVVADVRWLPFREASFDAIYSMGTVEHFDETQGALGEIYRILAHGGCAIIGVPNRWDPFLRPLLVAILYRLRLYGYGFEKSYTGNFVLEVVSEGAAGFIANARRTQSLRNVGLGSKVRHFR